MKPVVFLDSSVVVAALGSPTGASNGVFSASRKKQITCLISQSVLDEIEPRLYKVKKSPIEAAEKIKRSKLIILPPPPDFQVTKYASLATDPKDAHLFASCADIPHCILVSLDKKHILKLKNKTSRPKIMAPAEFLQSLVAHS